MASWLTFFKYLMWLENGFNQAAARLDGEAGRLLRAASGIAAWNSDMVGTMIASGKPEMLASLRLDFRSADHPLFLAGDEPGADGSLVPKLRAYAAMGIDFDYSLANEIEDPAMGRDILTNLDSVMNLTLRALPASAANRLIWKQGGRHEDLLPVRRKGGGGDVAEWYCTVCGVPWAKLGDGCDCGAGLGRIDIYPEW